MKRIITALLTAMAICFISGCGETDDTNSSYIDNSGMGGIKNETSAASEETEAVSDNTDAAEENTEPTPVSTLESVQTNFVKTAIRQDPEGSPFMTGLSTMRSIADKITSLNPDDIPAPEAQETAVKTAHGQESTVQSTENEKNTVGTEAHEQSSEKEQ